MRRTTKIFIGTLGMLFLISIGFIIYSAITVKNMDDVHIEMEMVSIEIPPHKVLYLDSVSFSRGNQARLYGQIEFAKSGGNDSNDANMHNKLEFSKFLQSSMTTSLVGDTLKISFNPDQLEIAVKYVSHRNPPEGCSLRLAADSSIKVISYLSGMGVHLKDVTLSDVSIFTTGGRLKMKGCNVGTLSFKTQSNGTFKGIGSKMDTLNIDLDEIGSWTFENCSIDVENVTSGKKWNSVDLPKTECREMNWIPKNDEARLEVKLGGGRAKISYR